MFQSLSGSLQASIRFLLHPLPSREFRLCYLGPTRSYRLLLDSVGLTLLCRLVFLISVRSYLFCDGILFTRFVESRATNPFHVPFGESLSALFSSFFNNAV